MIGLDFLTRARLGESRSEPLLQALLQLLDLLGLRELGKPHLAALGARRAVAARARGRLAGGWRWRFWHRFFTSFFAKKGTRTSLARLYSQVRSTLVGQLVHEPNAGDHVGMPQGRKPSGNYLFVSISLYDPQSRNENHPCRASC